MRGVGIDIQKLNVGCGNLTDLHERDVLIATVGLVVLSRFITLMSDRILIEDRDVSAPLDL
ncbi:MAG: hypothetical protein HN403_16690 [Rhodospirillales bacterium]|jgi:hypothetical protein|nr:hypothetical protein [Rhodospirillales bacterium]